VPELGASVAVTSAVVDATGTTPVPQRAVIVLPSTGEFDSRTYRIATTLVSRGHEVTVLARRLSGTAEVEDHPAGYRILRVEASTADGLPFPRVRNVVRRVLVKRRQVVARAASSATAAGAGGGNGAAGGSSASTAAGTSLDGDPTSVTVPSARRASAPRRAMNGLIRRMAIPLTIRSHVRRARLVAPAADLYHGMAFMGIPVALDLGRRHRAKVVYDARDIYLEARNLARMRGPMRGLLARQERGWAHAADRVMTVNQAYAEVMAERLRVPLPVIVMNCSYRFDPPVPRERRFHDALGLEPATRVVLYHGGLFPDRGIEQLMDAIRDVSSAVLVLMGYGVLEPMLRERAADPAAEGRIRLLPPVPPDELLAWVACADVVAMPIQPSTLNHRLTTPNKLFEAMAAGVPVVASDLPGMATIVRSTQCGLLCDPADPASIATALQAILDAPDEERLAYGRRGLEASHTEYSWERQAGILLAEYGRLTGRPW
jgi:glycosyltransferase involved in cell wall biosynthesis